MKSRDGEISTRLSLPIAEQVAGIVRPHGLVVLSWMGGKWNGGHDEGEPERTECGEGTSPWHPSFYPQTSVVGVAADGGDKASRTVGVVGGREFG